jgi:hypothetical protein
MNDRRTASIHIVRIPPVSFALSRNYLISHDFKLRNVSACVATGDGAAAASRHDDSRGARRPVMGNVS